MRKYAFYDENYTETRAPFRPEYFIKRYTTDNADEIIQHAREYRMIRNNIVHNRYNATTQEAESFLRFAESLLAQSGKCSVIAAVKSCPIRSSYGRQGVAQASRSSYVYASSTCREDSCGRVPVPT